MQIKVTLSYLILTYPIGKDPNFSQLPKSPKINQAVGKQAFSYTAGRKANWFNFMDSNLTVSLQIVNTFTLWPNNLIAGNWAVLYIKNEKCTVIHWRTVYNSEKVKTT